MTCTNAVQMSSKVCSDIYITELQLHNTMLHVVNPAAEGYGFRTLTQSDAMYRFQHSTFHLGNLGAWSMYTTIHNIDTVVCLHIFYAIIMYNKYFCVLKHGQ